jgi:hypothetical protein
MENNALSYEDCLTAKAYVKDAESMREKPEWYMIEQAFKDGICHAKGIQYDFLSDYDKDMMRLMVKQVKEQKEYIQKRYGS